MKSQYVNRQLGYVDFVFSEIDKQSLDPFIECLLAQYLAALICGIYEDAIEHLFDEYVGKETKSTELKNYIAITVDQKFRNPNEAAVKGILNLFNPQWSDQLDSRLQRVNWEALNTLYTNKNKIAHGTECKITYPQIKQNYQDSKKVIEEIDSLIL
jgi:hypothetical protein